MIIGQPIEKLSEFMECVETLPVEFTLSRGQCKDFALLPSALRLDDKGNKRYTRQSIATFINQFKVDSHNYMPSPWDVQNDNEWMIYAQHYGIPTKLLDFTYSHIIALMFSVQNAFNEEEPEDSVIWFLNPSKLNIKNCNMSKLISLSSDIHVKLDECDGPVVVQGRKLNNRINAQNGVFLYFQETEQPLEKLVDNNILKKMIISANYKKRILTSIYSMGIGFTQIYPELSSVAKDILMKDCIKRYFEEGE